MAGMVPAIQQPGTEPRARSVRPPARVVGSARSVGLRCLTLVLACGCSGGERDVPPRPAPPNIVLIVADDLGWMDVGYHAPEIPTPNIDRLVREGVELERFYTAPICSPTRAGLLTGIYPIRFGLQRLSVKAWHERGLPPEAQTIAELLEVAGYERRGLIGKWHLGRTARAFHPLQQGFTHFYGHYNGGIEYTSHLSMGALDWQRQYALSDDPGYSTRLIGKEAVRFIEESPIGSPFFLMVSFNAIHAPDEVPPEGLERVEHLPRGKRRVKGAMIASMDDEIGALLVALERRGIAGDTLVFFLSDNGGVNGSGSRNDPFRGGKTEVFEGGIRVPAAVRWPGRIRAGKKLDVPLSYLDVFPTLGRIAGARPAADPVDGRDVSRLLQGEDAPLDPLRLFSYVQARVEEDGQEVDRQAVLDGEWKLVRVGSVADAEVSLYRIRADPEEAHDVAAEHPAVVRQMLDQLATFRSWQPARLTPAPVVPPADWHRPDSWEIGRR